MRYVLLLLAAVACGDNKSEQRPADAGITPDAPVQALAPCLERPTDLPMPPAGALPCDLLPPDFVAP